MSEYRTVGDCLDAGVTWDQFHTDEWGGDQMFTSAADAEAHRDDLLADWARTETTT